MNAIEIYEKAVCRLDHNEITVGEFEAEIAVLKDVEPAQKWISVPADGLQKYIGVPVCILRKSDGQSWWAIIRGVESDKVSTDYGGWFKLSEYGETWTVKYLPLSELPKGE